MPPALRKDDAKLGVLRAGQEDALRKVVAMCAAAPVFGFDTETSKIEDWNLDVTGWSRSEGAYTVGYCLSWQAGRGVYVPFAHSRGLEGPYPDQMDFETVVEIVGPLVEGKLSEALLTGHNLTFDYRMCLKDGLRIRTDHDTSVAARMLSWATGRWDPRGSEDGGGVRSLKALTEELIGIEVIRFDDLVDAPTIPAKGKGSRAKKPVIDYAALDPFDPKVWRYAAADGSNSLHVLHRVLELVRKEGIEQAYKLETALIPAVAEMRQHGVLVDKDLALAKSREGRRVAEKLQADYRTYCTETLGREVTVDLDSPKQLAELLFSPSPQGFGLPVLKTSPKTGAPSTDKHVMEALERQYPVVKNIQTYKQITKNLGTYLEGYPKVAHPVTGRMHSNLDPLGTETGRFSSSAPNLQNMTAEGLQFELADGSWYVVNVRDTVVASPGFYWLDFDYSQIEYRGMAGEAGETSLIEGWRKDHSLDVHAMTAALIYGIPIEQVTKEQRRRGKTMNFAVLYGRGAVAVAEDLGISVDEAQRFLDEYFARLPAVRRWAEQTKIEARRNGWVQTLFGWKRNLPEYLSPNPKDRKRADRLAVNTKIQGVCAQIMKMGMVRAYRRIFEAGLQDRMRFVLTVHDSLGFEVKEGFPLEDAYAFCRDALIWDIPGWPPIDVDCKVGYRYGSLVDYEGPETPGFAMPVRGAASDPPPPETVDEVASLAVNGDDEDEPAAPVAPSPVLVEVPSVTADQAAALHNLILANPGPYPVSLRVSGQVIDLPHTTSLTPDSDGWIQAMGRCRVRWDVTDDAFLMGVKV